MVALAQALIWSCSWLAHLVLLYLESEREEGRGTIICKFILDVYV